MVRFRPMREPVLVVYEEVLPEFVSCAWRRPPRGRGRRICALTSSSRSKPKVFFTPEFAKMMLKSSSRRKMASVIVSERAR